MAQEQHISKLIMQTVGPLTVVAADGTDCTPKGRKAKGLLALLAMAPNNKRSRAWLQDKLWSDRGQEQGAGSLRQTLTEIRRVFNEARDCVVSDRLMIGLNTKKIEIRRSLAPLAPPGVSINYDELLFEDLDIPDLEFENWLRDQRTQFATEQLHQSSAIRAGSSPTPHKSIAGSFAGLQLRIESPATVTTSAREQLLADGLTDIVARTISELGSIDVRDFRRADALEAGLIAPAIPHHATLTLCAQVVETASGDAWRLVLSSTSTKRVLWSTGVQRPNEGLSVDALPVLRDLNQMVDEVFRNFYSNEPVSDEQHTATLLCQQGIQRLFQLGDGNLSLADEFFQNAFNIERRGIYLAWRAWLRTYLLVEQVPENRKLLTEEALDFMYRALELEPRNSYVAALCAHVHTVMRQSYVAAFELAERSIQLNRANPLGWMCLGVAECNLGKAEVGFEHTLIARELAGASPFRFHVNAAAGIAASIAGDIDSSILLGEAAHGLSPTFKPPLRFLTALYLLRDRHEDSQAMVEKLKITEPNFSYDLLRDRSYPASSLQRSKLLEKLPRRQV